MQNAAKQDDASSSTGYQQSRRGSAALMNRTDRPSLMSLQRRALAVSCDGATTNRPLLLDIGATMLPPGQRQNAQTIVQAALEQVLAMLEEDDFV